MAQFVMQSMVDENNLSEQFFIDSAATSTEALGCSIHHGSKRVMDEHNICYSEHTARQITAEDYCAYDYIIGMDESNKRNLINFYNCDPEGKISMLLDFTDDPRAIADPWYTGNFEDTYNDVVKGCSALLSHLCKKENIKAKIN